MYQGEPGSELRRDEGRRLFGLDPDGYNVGRPDYPESVYRTLAHRCGLGSGTRVLEIGPGTGLVTRRLLAERARVTAIEPDPAMAEYLRQIASSSDLRVVNSSLEEAEIERDGFDLAIAATSFHWVDQEVGLSKLGEGVRPGVGLPCGGPSFVTQTSQMISARPSRPSWVRRLGVHSTNQLAPHSNSMSRTDYEI